MRYGSGASAWLVAICLAQPACNGCDGNEQAIDASIDAVKVPDAGPRSRLEGCTRTRWAGRLELPPPAVPGWAESRIFPDGPKGGAPSGLGSYWLFEWRDPVTPPGDADVEALHAAAGARLDEDCVIVGPLGFEEDYRPVRRGEFRAQVGGFANALPAAADEPPATIRVAIPDSSPDGAPGVVTMGYLEHGFTMATIVQDLACPNPAAQPCSEPAMKLALPRLTNTVVDPDGGIVGTPVELAKAIYDAVQEWRLDLSNRPRLVVSVSVGWDSWRAFEIAPGEDVCDFPSDGSASTQAVYDAIKHARCLGALVVVAAGNHPGGPAVDGPGCPAAWEQDPAPADCVPFEGPGYPPPPPALPPGIDVGEYRPFLHSVGAIDDYDRWISITRAQGRPRLAALGFQGLGHLGGVYPRPLTGTSVPAPVVAGIAATIWAYRPSYSAAQVGDLIYQAGTLVPGDPADYWSPDPMGGNAPAIRRAVACSAVQAACASGKEACPAAISCNVPGPRSTPFLSTSLFSTLESELAGGPKTDFEGSFEASSPSCVGTLYTTRAPLGDACQQSLYPAYDAPPLVNPQPKDVTCGVCFYDAPSQTLFFLINPALAQPASPLVSPVILTDPTLTLESANGVTEHYAFELPSDAGGRVLHIGDGSLDWVEATLSFTANDRLSAFEPIPIQKN